MHVPVSEPAEIWFSSRNFFNLILILMSSIMSNKTLENNNKNEQAIVERVTDAATLRSREENISDKTHHNAPYTIDKTTQLTTVLITFSDWCGKIWCSQGESNPYFKIESLVS
jgi:hypothetical protein